MKQFKVFLKKEWTESVRDFKWIWMPIVFLIIGVMEPLTQYYTPQLIEKFGGLPEGAVIELPLLSAEQVIVSTSGQYSLFGILIIVLAFMGTLAGERKSGTAAMVLVKPVSYSSFVIAKWVHGTILVLVSFLIGMCIAWYYTYQLFGSVALSDFFTGNFVYSLWLIFLFTLTLFFSSFSTKSGVAAFGALGTTIIFSFISSLLPDRFNWSPFGLSAYAIEFWLGESPGSQLYISVIVTLALIVIMVIGSMKIFKQKELA